MYTMSCFSCSGYVGVMSLQKELKKRRRAQFGVRLSRFNCKISVLDLSREQQDGAIIQHVSIAFRQKTFLDCEPDYPPGICVPLRI